MSIANSKEVSF